MGDYNDTTGKFSYTVSPNRSRRFRPLAFICKAAVNFSERDGNGGIDTFGRWWEWNDFGGMQEYIKKLRGIAYVAWQQGHDCLVLGAFGCGAFSNDPKLVAKAMNTVFKHEFVGVFQKIVHCQLIVNPKNDNAVLNDFKTHFLDAPGSSHTPSGGTGTSIFLIVLLVLL